MKFHELTQNFENLFGSDWEENPVMKSYCSQVFTYLIEHRFDDVRHLTHSSFINLLNPKPSSNDLIALVRYLSGSRIDILDTNFELIDDNDECFVLSKDEISLLMREGILSHPKSGEVLHDPDDKVFMFFSPTEKIRRYQG